MGPVESFNLQGGTAQCMRAGGHPGGTGCYEGDKTGGSNEMQGNVGGWQTNPHRSPSPSLIGLGWWIAPP
jgi:hypothetical protein